MWHTAVYLKWLGDNSKSFTTKPISSGTAFKVIVEDKNKCSYSITVQNTCPEACNLPCAGIAVRCGYRFWLPTLDKEQNRLFQKGRWSNWQHITLGFGSVGRNSFEHQNKFLIFE